MPTLQERVYLRSLRGRNPCASLCARFVEPTGFLHPAEEGSEYTTAHAAMPQVFLRGSVFLIIALERQGGCLAADSARGRSMAKGMDKPARAATATHRRLPRRTAIWIITRSNFAPVRRSGRRRVCWNRPWRIPEPSPARRRMGWIGNSSEFSDGGPSRRSITASLSTTPRFPISR